MSELRSAVNMLMKKKRETSKRWRRAARVVTSVYRCVGHKGDNFYFVRDTGMSVPGSRKESLVDDSLFQGVTDFITKNQENGRTLTSYDLISRTLHQLARDGNSEVLSSALARLGEHGRRRINNLDGDKLSPLHYAARYAHADTVKTLIHAGANVNIRGEDKLTPLHFAARYRKQIKPNRRHSPVPPPPKDDDDTETEEVENSKGEENPDLTITSNESERAIGIGSIPENSVIRILVECGADVNARDIYDQIPLHYAAMRGNDPAARDLLKCPHIQYEARDKQLMTPLFVSATFGYVDISRRLILAGSSLFSKDESEQIPLHRASMEGHMEIIELLLTSASTEGGEVVKRLVSERDSEGQTSLHHAVNNGHIQVAARLLDAGADVDAVRDTLATPLHAAAAVGDTDLINLLLENHARLDSVDCNQQTPLHRAADHNQSAAIITLLEAGAKIERRDKDSFTPLLVAASAGHAAAVQTLLDHDADVEAFDKDDKTAVFWCAEQGNEEALEVLLNNIHCQELVDVSDRYDNSPLHEAAKHGYMIIINKLLEAGSLVDNKNEDGETALHVAAEAGHVKVVRELIHRYKFLLSDENEESNTPLHLACLQGHTDVVRTLLEAGAAVDATNSSLWTPLDCASAKGHVMCVHLLLDYDSPLDPLDKTKTTPLQLAAKNGHVAVIRLLLERGASLTACDTSGRNALELAIAAGKKDVCMAIIKSSEWETSLRNVRIDHRDRRITPFRMLIKKFPDVAEAVLDKCTTTNGMDSDDRRFAVSFNFELVDDTYTTYQYGNDIDSLASNSTLESPFDEDGFLLDHAEPYTTEARELKENHPLMLMVKYKRLNLLAHPVSISLVKHKWMKYGRFVYYSVLIFYMVFLTFLTGYILTARDWASVEKKLNNSLMVQSAKEQHSCEALKDEVDLTDSVFVVAGKWVIIVMAVINIMREMFQFYQGCCNSLMARLNYIGLENLMEWCCYITAVVLVWDFNDCSIRQNWQWQVGAASIFLGWMNLLLFIRKFPFLGIFVVMFTDIFATFLKFFTVFLLFIVAFALAFYTVLRNQEPFSTPGHALLKTTVMMIGEFEYDTIFNEENLIYPEVTYTLFVVFLILMSILIMNLLVGLAVDDIKAVQDQAILKRLAMQTQMVLDVEVLIPETLRRIQVVAKKEVHPNARHGLFSRLFGDFQLIKTFDFVLDDEQMNEQEAMRRDMTHLITTVEDLQSQNQRLRALLIALINISNNGSKGNSDPDVSKYV
ncbi:transient receptor potential cation channel subfamily A member 1 homolog isoform X3 [Homarus americanus]|uniref:transient receptor potential cation channel subfamily A member 1 homolog isoform X3 n=1 Tax=Homarus americanus TaxID=6706 RepID=UPI001C45EC09|nr:transient receptor potential cation channel subfamily A member 1 homolog isoform X3 [Homarus americanus]